jgi:hypothetical protein
LSSRRGGLQRFVERRLQVGHEASVSLRGACCRLSKRSRPSGWWRSAPGAVDADLPFKVLVIAWGLVRHTLQRQCNLP